MVILFYIPALVSYTHLAAADDLGPLPGSSMALIFAVAVVIILRHVASWPRLACLGELPEEGETGAIMEQGSSPDEE